MPVDVKFGVFDEEDFVDHLEEVFIISDILWAHGYEVSDRDAYLAWKAGGDGFWDHPYDFEPYMVVKEVLDNCTIEYDNIEVTAMSDEDWDSLIASLEEDMEDYEPKSEPRTEGGEWDSEGNYFTAPTEAGNN